MSLAVDNHDYGGGDEPSRGENLTIDDYESEIQDLLKDFPRADVVFFLQVLCDRFDAFAWETFPNPADAAMRRRVVIKNYETILKRPADVLKEFRQVMDEDSDIQSKPEALNSLSRTRRDPLLVAIRHAFCALYKQHMPDATEDDMNAAWSQTIHSTMRAASVQTDLCDDESLLHWFQMELMSALGPSNPLPEPSMS